MKWEQIDTALEFFKAGVTPLVLQCERYQDVPYIMRHVFDTMDTVPDLRPGRDSATWVGYGTVVVRPITRENDGYRMENLFFIERACSDYVEGQIIKEWTPHGRELPLSSVMGSRTTATIKPKQPSDYLAIRSVAQMVTDPSTLVIQYDDPSLENRIIGLVRSYRRQSAESFLDCFTHIDIFVDINPQSDKAVPWKRIAYECTKGNPDPGARFGGAYFIKVSQTFTKPEQTLDMLLEGR